MTALLENRIGQPAEVHLAEFYKGGKQYIASFSDIVFAAAEKGDAVAMEILNHNMCSVARMMDAAYGKFAIDVPVLFFGGISSHYEVLFPLIRKYSKKANIQLEYISEEQVSGALLRAKQLLQ